MDGLYLPDGRQLALIDRDWILDELPHLGNPDDNSDAYHLLATSAAAAAAASTTSGAGAGTGTAQARSATAIGAGSTSSQTAGNHNGVGFNGNDGTANGHNHSLLCNQDEFEGDLTLLSEIVDETQNKWSDLALNQLLTAYARSTRSAFK